MRRRRHPSHPSQRQRRLMRHQKRSEEYIEERMIKLSLNHSMFERNLKTLISILEETLHIYSEKIKEVLLRCAMQMPDACTIYTTLIGLLNINNPTFTSQVIEGIVNNFRTALEFCKWEEARNYLRFLADLVNCGTIQIDSFMTFLDYIVDIISREETPQAQKDFVIAMVLGCLPWVGKILYENKKNSFDRLLLTIQVYLSKRKNKYVPLLQVWTNKNPHQQEEYLECLMAQILNLKDKNWNDGHIFRPYLKFKRKLAQESQYKLPVVVPPSYHESFQYPLPRVVFRLFDHTDCPEGTILPEEHTINRFLIEDHLKTLFERFHKRRRDCARQMLNVYYKKKVPLSYCIVEVIFGELFNLPTKRHLDIAYASILIELCKQDPISMPQVLVQATKILFNRMPTMNLECIERFANWFSFHMSNFNMRWSWSGWTTILSINKEEAQPKFLREVLFKLLRLYHYKKIKDILPEEYRKIMPKEPEPNLKLYQQMQEKVNEIFENNLSADEIVSKLEKQIEEQKINQSTQITIVIHHLLNLEMKTFTDTFLSFDKYYNVLKLINKTPQDQQLILENIFIFWKKNQQRLVIIINQLLKIQILNFSSVINWIFSKKMRNELKNGYIWEILHAMIKQTINLINIKWEEYKILGARCDRDPDFNLSNDTQESLQKIQDTIKLAETDKKNLLLEVFQQLITQISKHLDDSDQNKKDFNTYWYRYMLARFQQMLLTYHAEIREYLSIFEVDLFDDNLHFRLLEIYKQFISLWE